MKMVMMKISFGVRWSWESELVAQVANSDGHKIWQFKIVDLRLAKGQKCIYLIALLAPNSALEINYSQNTQSMMTKLYLILAVAALYGNVAWGQGQDRGVESYTEAYSGSRTTYDWGKHTGNDYDWGQHTGSTYDWGQHTQAPNGNGHENNNGQNNGEQESHMWQHRCGGGQWTCAGAANLCIDITRMCDNRVDCPQGEDEDPTVCKGRLAANNKPGAAVAPARPRTHTNRFRGQGFMFHIKNIKITHGSNVRLFDQESDNNIKKSG